MIKQHAKATKTEIVKRIFFLTLGAVLVALAIENFLVPNKMIDGGIVGISIMLSHLSGVSLGIFLLILNLPFLVIGYKKIGKTFALSTLYAVAIMSIGTSILHHSPTATDQPLLAAIFGGIIMGVGVGLVIKFGGSTDGVEISAILISDKSPFSVGEVVMFINAFILVSAGFVFGWDSAMFSLIAYYIAYKMIDVVMQGLDESKSAWIISKNPQDVGDTIQARLGRGVTYISAKGGFSNEPMEMIYCVFNRLEESKLKQIVKDVDPNASIAIENVHDLHGDSFKKRNIH